jgi:bifunctional ADP-heptose synthase (sugar kinase/adenylyltransferase)
VARLKGAGRPLVPALERAELLGALRAVDHVVIFEEDSADALLSAVRPHVHAKGTDYTQASVPEAATARIIGAEVAIVGDPKAHATRDVIAAIAARCAHKA